MKGLKVVLIVAGFVIAAGIVYAYAGLYNVAADEPHWATTAWLMTTTRQRSIAVRARNVGTPPALDDPALLAMGAEHYAEMCAGCHLAPGMADSEMRKGLYPQPPKLAEPAPERTQAETFWVIKHGLKMSGMPAWGATHDDRSIWALVAFVHKLSELTPGEYEALVAQGRAGAHEPGAEDEDEHSHGEGPHPHEHSYDSDQPHAH